MSDDNGAPEPPVHNSIEDDAMYDVVLTRSIKVGRSTIHAGNRPVFSGEQLRAVLSDQPSAIAGYYRQE